MASFLMYSNGIKIDSTLFVDKRYSLVYVSLRVLLATRGHVGAPGLLVAGEDTWYVWASICRTSSVDAEFHYLRPAQNKK